MQYLFYTTHMNAPERLLLPDVQSAIDTRQIAIGRVGIRSVRQPLSLLSADGTSAMTVATVDLYVGLPAEQKGTHMSRFLEVLEMHGRALSGARLGGMFEHMLERLAAQTGFIEMRFPYFMEKTAPMSGMKSLLDYDVTLRCEKKSAGDPLEQWLQVLTPVTSLCPCSKEISAYGAHNQRSHVTINVMLAEDAATDANAVNIGDLAVVAERAASCELYGLLKRSDEKYVTERAYENPKFVEDLVRDIALELQLDARIAAFTVESENFESIHNHSAYARIDVDKRVQDKHAASVGSSDPK